MPLAGTGLDLLISFLTKAGKPASIANIWLPHRIYALKRIILSESGKIGAIS
jgi:hypothetical protein